MHVDEPIIAQAERAAVTTMAVPVTVDFKVNLEDWRVAHELTDLEVARGHFVHHFSTALMHRFNNALTAAFARFTVDEGGEIRIHVPSPTEINDYALARGTVKVIELRAYWLARKGWSVGGDLDRVADEMALLLKLLFQAGYDVQPYVNQWQHSYHEAVHAGVKLSYREVWNEGDVENQR